MPTFLKFYHVFFLLATASIVSGQKQEKEKEKGCVPGSGKFEASRIAPKILPSIVGRTIGCIDGVASGYPCNNIALESFVPNAQLNGGQSTEANDVWGWSKNGREFAIIGLQTGTSFVEITDPINPVVLGKLPTKTSSSSWRDIKTYGDYALIVSEASGHGMQVFDLTQLLDIGSFTVFTETAHYSDFGNAHNVFVNEHSGYAYAVGTDSRWSGCRGGLHMVNINNPLIPSFAGCYSAQGYTHDVQCVMYDGPDEDYTGREICFASNEDTMDIIDVTDKANPTIINIFTYANDEYTHQGWLTEDKKYFLIDDELDEQRQGSNTRTVIVDVSDLNDPDLVGFHFGETAAIDHNQYVKGGYTYQANYRAGLRILDLNDIENGSLHEVAFFDTHPDSDSANFNGAWSTYPYFDSGVVVISDIEQGLFVVRPELTPPPPPGPTFSPAPTALPTPAPTQTPTQTPPCDCPSGTFPFKLKVFTDRYPQETSWDLKNDEGDIIFENPTLARETLYEEEGCYPNDCYTFTITDSYRDGICCGYGEGWYEIYIDGTNTPSFSGGDFGASDTKSFCPEFTCGTPAPSPAPTSSPTSQPTSSPTMSPSSSPVSNPSNDPWVLGTADVSIFGNSLFVSHGVSTGPEDTELVVLDPSCDDEIGEDEVVLASDPVLYYNENVTYRLILDGSKLNSSDLVTFEDDSNTRGTIKFCTKLDTKIESGLAITSRKVKFNVAFEMATEFVLESVISDDEDSPVETFDLNLEFSVDACECNENFECESKVYVDGDTAPLFRVCITPTGENLQVSNMQLTMTGQDGYEYEPVEFGTSGADTDALTDLSESGSTVMVTTRVVDGLFQGDSFTANGVVLLNVAGSSKQANSDFSEFNFKVSTLQLDNGPVTTPCFESLLKRFFQ